MYGIIDIGSNTMRLSCYCITGEMLKPLFHKKSMAGLAGYVDNEGCLSEDGLEKAINTLESFRNMIEIVGISEFYVIATASFRNVNNTDEIVSKIYEATGFRVNVLTGEEEAMYDFKGSRYYSDIDSGLIVDIGGGSTELVSFKKNDIRCAESLPIGSLNIYKKHVDKLFPSADETKEIRSYVRKKLDNVDTGKTNIILGVGGSIRACTKLYNNYYNYTPTNRHMVVDRIRQMMDELFMAHTVDLDMILKNVPDRVHTIIPGLLILDEICKYCKAEIVELSTGGLREGYMIEKLFANFN